MKNSVGKPTINGWDPFRQRIQKSTGLESYHNDLIKKMAVMLYRFNTIKKQTFIDNKSIILYSSSIVFSGTIEHGSSAEQ